MVALINTGDEILLVNQQGENDAAPGWSVPGGVVEDGEMLKDALRREVREETGIEVLTVGPIEYVVNSVHDGINSIAIAFNVVRWRGTPKPDDPDGLVFDCRFVSLPESIELVERLPYRTMREPLLAYLTGDAELGKLWEYT